MEKLGCGFSRGLALFAPFHRGQLSGKGGSCEPLAAVEGMGTSSVHDHPSPRSSQEFLMDFCEQPITSCDFWASMHHRNKHNNIYLVEVCDQ